MDTALIVGVIGGGVGLVSTITAAVMTTRTARSVETLKLQHEAERRQDEEKKQISIYSEALARAAFDLQSRLYNFLHGELAAVYIQQGTERERSYMIDNTAFLIGQFFCWVELARQEINFIQLDDPARTKALLRKQDEIYAAWGTDKLSAFRIFAGEQRAIGEALIQGEPEYTTCMGYGSFLATYPRGAHALIDYVRGEVEALPKTLDAARARLTTLQHMMIDIIDILDEERLRFPEKRRSKA